MSVEFEKTQLSCDLPLDCTGFVVHNELVLSGWAVSPDHATGVLVDIDDRTLNASFGLDTPDLPTAMPEMPGADRAGYVLRVDTSCWEPGPRKVTISAYDRKENRTQVSGEVTIRPFEPPARTLEENLARIEAGKVAMWLDAPHILKGPCAVEDSLEIFGWAHASGGIEAVTVTLDGYRQHHALRPIARPDLLADYGQATAIDAGFVSRLLDSECSAGSHSLSVVALGQNGDAVGVTGEIIFGPGPADDSEAAQVEWREDLPTPRRREAASDRKADPSPWEDRALLAEADAAESRAEAQLAQTQQRSLARKWRILDAKAQAFDTASPELALKTAELESLRSELDVHATELDLRTAEVAGYRAELQLAREEVQALATLQGEVASRDAQLATHGAELARLRAELAGRDAELADRDAELSKQEAELVRRDTELESITGSQSWKLTRPLRFLSRAARRVFAGSQR